MDNKTKLKSVPVTKRITDMGKIVDEIKKDINEGNSSAAALHEENEVLKVKTDEKAQEIMKMIFDDLDSLENELLKIKEADANEMKFIEQQINSLDKDRQRLKQNIQSIESRLNNCETVFGIGLD